MTRPGNPCVHCGICLSACPTYRLDKEEAESPRGRLMLMDALANGEATPGEVRPHLDRCIGCRACESVCPSGVAYGERLEEARRRLGGPRRPLAFVLRQIVKRPRPIVALARLLGLAPPRPAAEAWPTPPARPKARIALHLGCVTPHLYPGLVSDTAHLLTHLGYAVESPAGQTCCGALLRHAGLDAAGCEERNAKAFLGFDAVVSPASGCSTTAGITDVCRLLARELPLSGARLPPVRVAFDPPCHLLHGQRVDATPLLRAIDGVTLVPLDGASDCCGAGGIYMESQRGFALRVRAPKLDAILRSGAEVVATANPGCMLWLWRGLKAGRAIEVVHPVSLLRRALSPRDPARA